MGVQYVGISLSRLQTSKYNEIVISFNSTNLFISCRHFTLQETTLTSSMKLLLLLLMATVVAGSQKTLTYNQKKEVYRLLDVVRKANGIHEKVCDNSKQAESYQLCGFVLVLCLYNAQNKYVCTRLYAFVDVSN